MKVSDLSPDYVIEIMEDAFHDLKEWADAAPPPLRVFRLAAMVLVAEINKIFMSDAVCELYDDILANSEVQSAALLIEDDNDDE